MLLQAETALLLRRSLASQLSAHQQQLMARGLPKRAPLPDVQDIVVVASGKGGVGKSTVAANLAVSLTNLGKRVGLLDADIFGPSIPLLMNLKDTPLIDAQNMMLPPINYGVKCNSMGLLAKADDAIIWRGPLVMSAVQRLLKGTLWAPLDILIVDTPPGTGDVHLSITQHVPISGVLLVSTPQKAALDVTLRGAEMYRKLKVPILGLVENMRYAICSNCQTEMQIFNNNTQQFLSKIGTHVLASIPLDGCITDCGDTGVPVVAKQQQSAHAESYKNLAEQLVQALEQQQKKNKVS